ncbi:DUF3703 domain-containing protein [Aliiglaciecola sp. SL4]|uniref:DUF3703 domain-containing protein n=1 Tax=Aliiglaciecola sp. SL4 TaxID=3239806 RepID=UPI00355B139F
MYYTEYAKPFVENKIALAQQAIKGGDQQQAFRYLEDAHVIAQKSTYLHCLVHYLMLKHGYIQWNIKEMSGQIFRLVGALTKTWIGWIPTGNTGGTNVSPFKPMPISAHNQKIIDVIEQKIKQQIKQ